MPTYEYECDGCGDRFERFQKISARPVRKCPSCGKQRVRRLISVGGGLIFKGSGFYVTDSKRGGTTSEAKPDSKRKKTQRKKQGTRRAKKSDSGGQT